MFVDNEAMGLKVFEDSGMPEHPGLTEMKELERLAAKSPCMMTEEQWKQYESWQVKENEVER